MNLVAWNLYRDPDTGLDVLDSDPVVALHREPFGGSVRCLVQTDCGVEDIGALLGITRNAVFVGVTEAGSYPTAEALAEAKWRLAFKTDDSGVFITVKAVA